MLGGLFHPFVGGRRILLRSLPRGVNPLHLVISGVVGDSNVKDIGCTLCFKEILDQIGIPGAGEGVKKL